MSTLGLLAGLAAGRLIEVNQVDDRLSRHNSRLLAQAVRVSQESQRLIQAATHSTDLCSESDVATLRVLLFNATFLRDIGRLRDGMLVCSAAWGVLAFPHPLPPASFTTRHGTTLWVGAANIIDRRIIGDMAARNDVVVFTAPGAFDGFPEPGSGIDSQLVTRDGAHVFRRFGRSDGLVFYEGASPSENSLRAERLVAECAPPTAPDICAVSRVSSHDWFTLPALILAGTGALVGGLLAGLCVLWHQQSKSERAALRKAIRRGGVQVRYQPLRELSTRRLVGVEALARWRGRDGSAVPPALFVPLAEEMGLGRELSRVVTQIALHDLAGRLRDATGFYVSINVSAEDLQDDAYPDFLLRTVNEQGIAPPRVALEITEGSPLSDGHVRGIIRTLRTQGFRILIDDFGTGNSNLNYLAEMQADTIKLDRRFTQAIGAEPAGTLIIDHVIDISRALGVGLIVEGIETEDQAQYLTSRQPAAVGQGWLLGRAVRAEDIPLA
ncbi:EAL domain-containing protein [Achromobacter marplatensis]|jgi:sensor c-di-GMP phosphodiesterase-like protein|uniref:EAL domain-containing protein n=1 Tax=Achromobacter marplatensis TaxID=470868 RepID=UPI0028F172DF|nr:EAL domain-containing protein [Achromobacter marplatensis]